MLDLAQDFGRRGRPDEWTGVLVVFSQVLIDGADEFRDVAERAAADALAGDLTEPPLDQIEPRRSGGHEVEVVPLMGREPRLDLRVLVRPVVIKDQVDLAPTGRGPGHPFHEGQKLFVTVPREAASNPDRKSTRLNSSN